MPAKAESEEEVWNNIISSVMGLMMILFIMSWPLGTISNVSQAGEESVSLSNNGWVKQCPMQFPTSAAPFNYNGFNGAINGYNDSNDSSGFNKVNGSNGYNDFDKIDEFGSEFNGINGYKYDEPELECKDDSCMARTEEVMVPGPNMTRQRFIKHSLEHRDTSILLSVSMGDSELHAKFDGGFNRRLVVSTSASVSIVTSYPPGLGPRMGSAVVRLPSVTEMKKLVPTPARVPSVLAGGRRGAASRSVPSCKKPLAGGALHRVGARRVPGQWGAAAGPPKKREVPVGQVTFNYKVQLKFQPAAPVEVKALTWWPKLLTFLLNTRKPSIWET